MSAMEGRSLNTRGSQIPSLIVPNRRFIITLDQLAGLPPFYLNEIEVYRNKGDQLFLLNRQDIARLRSTGLDPFERSTLINRQSWDNLEIVIPAVEESSPFDSNTDIYKAHHLAVVVAGAVPKLTADLPEHLRVVDSYMESRLQRSLPLCRMPDYFVEFVQVLDVPFKKTFSNFSNCLVVIKCATPTSYVSVNSKLNLSKGTIDYTFELTPTPITTTSAGQENFHGPILLWNCRGANKEAFVKNIQDLDIQHEPGVLILTDTRIESHEMDKTIEILPFKHCHSVLSVQGSGGIWFMYRERKVQVRRVTHTDLGIKATLLNLVAINEDIDDSAP